MASWGGGRPAGRRAAGTGGVGGHDERYGLVEVRARDGEPIGDDPREVPGFRPVQPEQGGHRQEERQPKAGEGVAVDVDAGRSSRSGEALVAQARRPRLLDGGGDLVVEECDRVVVAHHDVEQVQVAVDDAAAVDVLQGALHLVVQLQCPRGEPGVLALTGRRIDERVALHDRAGQRRPVDVLHGQEPVLSDPEQVVHLGDAGDALESAEGVVLSLDPSDGVVSPRVQAGVRPCLLEHHLPPGAGVGADVDAAAVGEVHHPLDRVRQVGDGDGVPCGQVRLEERRQVDP